MYANFSESQGVQYEFRGKNFRGKNNGHTNHFHFKCHTIASYGKKKIITSFALTTPTTGTTSLRKIYDLNPFFFSTILIVVIDFFSRGRNPTVLDGCHSINIYSTHVQKLSNLRSFRLVRPYAKDFGKTEKIALRRGPKTSSKCEPRLINRLYIRKSICCRRSARTVSSAMFSVGRRPPTKVTYYRSITEEPNPSKTLYPLFC